MSTTPTPAPTGASAAVSTGDPRGPQLRPRRGRDALWVVGVLLVLGVVGGLVWQWVAPVPRVLRTDQGAVLDQAQLGVKIGADGWFVVIGLVAGLVAGFSLVRPKRRDALLVVVLGTVVSVAAAYVALRLGTTLGDVPRSRILDAQVGSRVDAPLQVISRIVLVSWPVGFLIAAVAVLWGGGREDARRTDAAAVDVDPPAPPG